MKTPNLRFIPAILLTIGVMVSTVPVPALAQTTTSAAHALGTLAPVASAKPSSMTSHPLANPAQAPTDVNRRRPPDYTPLGMFLTADIVVKIVLCILIFAALLTWTIWLSKTLELTMAKRRLRQAHGGLENAQSLNEAAKRADAGNGVIRMLLRAAAEEWRQSADALEDRDGLKERIALHLERVEAASGRRMMIGTGILATIGSTAPFIGLFGTVWGIMNSFIGISEMHTTDLAVVAPGIAEALLATAMGLVAAIPAVVIYNHFVRQIAAYKALVADAAALVMRLASRDLSRRLAFQEAGGRPRMVMEPSQWA